MDSPESLQVLIVDDEPKQASLLKMLLEGEFSASAEIAGDCASAREKFRPATPDIITVDYQLPDGDGLELLREINSMDSPPPVIMITAQGDESTAADSIRLGASGYVVKDQRLYITLPEIVRETLDRQTVKRALQESEEKYRTLYESSMDGISAVDLDGRIIECNSAFERMLGYTFDELKELSFLDITPEKWRGLDKEMVQKVMERGFSEPFEKEYTRKDGSVLPISTRTWLIRDDHGDPAGMWAITRDITDRKRAEEEITRLGGRLIEEGESVRTSVAADIHDGVGQLLNTIKMAFDMQLKKGAGYADYETAEWMATTSNLLMETIDKVRNINAELVPVGLTELGLDVALEEYLEGFARETGAALEFKTEGVPRRLGLELETSLFRIVQEALTNIRKHSKASNVEVSISWSESLVSLSVRDDGAGFDPDRTYAAGHVWDHVGLVAMRERARILKGEFTVESEPGAGTTVIVSVPLECG